MSEAPDAGAAGSTTEETGEAATAFDAEFAAFLGHNFDDPDVAAAEAEAAQVEAEPEATPVASPAPASTEAAPPAANAEPPAAAEGAATTPDPDQVDPADLAAAMGFTEEPAPAAPAATTEPATPPTSATTAEDEPYMPFTPTFKLPPEIRTALFEDEDVEKREAALVGLLSSFGNTITQVIDARMKERETALRPSILGEVQYRQAAQAVNQHFYGANKDLVPYKKVVQSAFAVVSKKMGPTATYSPEMAAEVAKLARATLKATGIALAPAAGAPPAPAKTPAARAPGSGFEAGGSRPAAAIGQDSGPAGLVDELSQW